MCSGAVAMWAVFGLIVGLPLAAWPYKLARLNEMLDAIGRKPSGRVEPAEWRVKLNRVAGVAMSLFGGGYVAYCLVLS